MTINDAKADQEAIVLENVMKATGLSEKQARELLLMDDDSLDNLCDAAVSDVGQSVKHRASEV